MGEIAEATLDGLFCEGCGAMFDDMQSPGHTRRCSSCRGAERRQRRRDDSNAPFICKDDRGLRALKYWLRERPHFNVVNALNMTNGKFDIRLGYDTKPDSDWGKWMPAGLILCWTEELRTAAAALAETERKNRETRK